MNECPPNLFFPFLFTRNLVKVTQTKADKSRHATVSFIFVALLSVLAFLTLFFIVFQAQLRTNSLWSQQEVVKEAFSDKIGLDHIAKKMTSTGSTAGSGGPKAPVGKGAGGAPSGGSGKRGSTTRYSILSDPRLSQLFALSSQLEALAQSIDVQPPSSQNQPQKSKKAAGTGLCKQTTTTTGGLLGTASPARYPP